MSVLLMPRGMHSKRLLNGSPQTTLCIAAILGVVLVANALYLFGVFDPNPLNQVSGLTSGLRPGPFPGGNTIDPNVGFTSQALGHRAALDWLGGHIPWWNPFEGIGAPLAGEMQAAALFPLSLLLYFSTGQIYFHLILECVAGISTFLLLSRFVRYPWVAVAGGLAFALNGTFAWTAHAPVNPIAFLPLLLLGIERAFEAARRGAPGRWGLIAVALALSIYAGFPEGAYINGILAAFWLFGRLLSIERSSRRSAVLRTAIGVAVGVLLAAPILVAFLDYLPYADIGAHSGAFAYSSFSRAALPQVVFPYVYGPLFAFDSADRSGVLSQLWGGGYASALLVSLAAIGSVGNRNRPLRLMLLSWVVLAIGKTFGVSLITHLVNHIPGISATAFAVYAATSWEFSIIFLVSWQVVPPRNSD